MWQKIITKNKLKGSAMDFFAYMLLFLTPFERIPSWEVGGLTMRLSTLVLLSFSVVLLPQFLLKKKFLPLSSIDKSILFFLTVTYLSIFGAADKERALTVSLLLTFVIIGYLLISRTLGKGFNFEKVTRVIVISALVTAAFGFFQFFADGLFNLSPSITGLLPRYTKQVLGFARLQSVGVEPLYYANFLLLPLFILAGRILAAEKPTKFDLWCFPIILTTFILTLSRGAYIALFAGFFVLAILVIKYKNLRKHLPKLILLGVTAWALSQIAVLSVSGSGGVSDFTEQFADPEKTMESSTNPRMESYLEALRLFKEKPILGVGIGNFGVVNQLPQELLPEGYAIVNNQYLETLAETGIVGFLALLALGIIIIVKLIKSLGNKNPSAPAVALTATFAAMLIQYNFFSTIYILYLWIIIALIDSLPLSSKNKNEKFN